MDIKIPNPPKNPPEMPEGFIPGIKAEKQGHEWVATLSVWLFLIGVTIFFGWLYGEFHKDKSDNYYFKDGSVVFIESKCLLGSIVHKDVVILTDENIIIRSHSFFGTKSTTYPYNILKEVVFSKWLCQYKLVIKYPSSFLTPDSTKFYFNKKDTFDTLNIQFHVRSRNRCIITESF